MTDRIGRARGSLLTALLKTAPTSTFLASFYSVRWALHDRVLN